MKHILITLAVILCSTVTTYAQEQYDEQLRQLTSEIATFTVGTPDQTFESCTYTDRMLTFVVNPNSQIGKARLADPFAENFYENLLAQMFGGNPQQGIQIMDFLAGTNTAICFKIMPPGLNDYSTSTVWPGDVKAIIQKATQQQ